MRSVRNMVGMSVMSTHVSLSYPCERFCSSFSLAQLSVLLLAYFALLSVVHVSEVSLTLKGLDLFVTALSCSDIFFCHCNRNLFCKNIWFTL